MTPYLQQRTLYPPLVASIPSPDLRMIVTVPAYREAGLLNTLRSLERCRLPEDGDVEVLVLINHSDREKPFVRQQSLQQYEELSVWARSAGRCGLKFHILHCPDLPSRHAGVGLARKILMDEACFRFAKADKEDGIIACLDADAVVDKNYLQALDTHFRNRPQEDACSIRFAHPLGGMEHPESVYEAIAQYELHLRVFLQWQRWAGFPFAYHTVGSSMAVRALAYQQQGGMNRRQAGEDFYFLQKFIELGRMGELQDTCVIPSPRLSDRVPFGTGRAVSAMLSKGQHVVWNSYSPDVFFVLRDFYVLVPQLYENGPAFLQGRISPVLESFLQQVDFATAFRQIRGNVASASAFRKRFFRWFTAFRQMKFLHYARDRGFPDRPVQEVAEAFLKLTGQMQPIERDVQSLLLLFRRLECEDISDQLLRREY